MPGAKDAASGANDSEAKTVEEKVDQQLKTFSAEEISKHNTEKDCWVVIHGNVYDVTKYLDDHPGGQEIICDVAGQDATEEFEDTGHSADARGILKEHLIGKASISDKDKAAKAQASNSSKSSGNAGVFVIVAFIVALAAAAAALYGDQIMALMNKK